MDQITENVWLGSWKDVAPFKGGKRHSLKGTKIITVAIDSLVKGDYFFPLTDPGTNEMDRENFFGAADLLEELVSQGYEVLVHCVSGANRSVSVVMAYLMKTYNKSLQEAYNFILERRRGICPYYKNLEHALAYNRLSEDFDRSLFQVTDATNAEKIVHLTYETILDRKADPDGLRHYTELLERGKIDQVKLAEILRGSSEFKNKMLV